ncbi:MAG TPA: hypothetical protein VIV54_07700 [Burkholderiales bacterium]
MTLTGIASSGPFKKASVTAFCGKTESSPIGTATTADGTGGTTAGSFTITVTPCSGPVKIVVKPAATGTQIEDEVKGNITPPSTLRLTAYISNTSTTTAKNVTPFTHVAAVVADQASTVSSAVVAASENAVITTIFGNNINAYNAQPKLIGPGQFASATPAEQQLATLRAAVSALAQTSTCSSAANDGDRLACAITALENQTKAVVSMSDSGTATITAAATTPPTMLRAALATLATTNTTVVAPEVLADAAGTGALLDSGQSAIERLNGTTLPSPDVQGGIQTAVTLFTNLRSDVTALANSTNTGFLDTKLAAVEADFRANGRIAGLSNDLLAILAGSNLSRSVETQDTLGLAFDGTGYSTSFDRGSCRVALATPTQATCSYSVESSGAVPFAMHTLTISKGTTSGSVTPYNWSDSVFNSTGARTGTASFTTDATGQLTAATLNGSFVGNGEIVTLTNLGLSQSTDASGNMIVAMSGTVSASVNGTAVATYALAPDTKLAVRPATATTGEQFVGFSASLSLTTAAFKYDGTLTFDSPTTDASGTQTMPTHASFVGTVFDMANGTASEFLKGTLDGHITNWSQFNATAPRVGTNFETGTTTFTGKVTTATNVYQVTFTLARNAEWSSDVTLSYTKGTSMIISISGRAALGGATTTNPDTLTISGSGITVELTRANGATSGIVKSGTTQIGTIAPGTNRVTFDDGTFLLIV